MVKKILTGLLLILFISSCFAGYSSGGRSGFSSRSSARSSSYSYGRSGYSGSTNTSRPYVAPSRSYSSSASNNTVIHNNHYSHGGLGGGGFFSGLLGGYIGGSLAGGHAPVVVNGGAVPMGQGPMIEGYSGVTPVYHSPWPSIFGFIFGIVFLVFAYKIIMGLFITNNDSKNRW